MVFIRNKYQISSRLHNCPYSKEFNETVKQLTLAPTLRTKQSHFIKISWTPNDGSPHEVWLHLDWPRNNIEIDGGGLPCLAMVRLIRCYTCNLTFDIDKKEEEIEAKEHSRSCHEMTLGFRAWLDSELFVQTKFLLLVKLKKSRLRLMNLIGHL